MGLVIFFWEGVLFVRSIGDMGFTFCTFYSGHGGYFLYVLFETHVVLIGKTRPDYSPISDLAPSWGGYFFP